MGIRGCGAHHCTHKVHHHWHMLGSKSLTNHLLILCFQHVGSSFQVPGRMENQPTREFEWHLVDGSIHPTKTWHTWIPNHISSSSFTSQAWICCNMIKKNGSKNVGNSNQPVMNRTTSDSYSGMQFHLYVDMCIYILYIIICTILDHLRPSYKIYKYMSGYIIWVIYGL